MSLSDLLQWWNLIFILPFIAGVIYLVLMMIGAVSSEFDADHEIEFDHDVDVDHDVGVEHDAEAEGDGEGESGLLLSFLSVLGFGRVPVSILIISLCFTWGFSGWASNVLLKGIFKFPLIFFWISLAVAFFSSVIITRYLAIAISKVMPATETYVTKRRELIGKRAEALVKITRDSGAARLYDQFGNLLDVNCRLRGEQEEVLPGGRVVLMEYDEAEGVYYVGPDRLGQLEK